MKTISKIFGLTLVLGLSLGFASCGGDDDGPAAVKKDDGVISHVKKVSLVGFANRESDNTADNVVFTLSEALSDAPKGDRDTQNFVSATIGSAADVYIKVSGVQGDTKLEDFCVKIGNNAEVNLGTVSTSALTGDIVSGSEYNMDTKHIAIINNVFTAVTTGSKEAKIVVKFTPTSDILSSNNINFEVKIAGKYIYNTYPQ